MRGRYEGEEEERGEEEKLLNERRKLLTELVTGRDIALRQDNASSLLQTRGPPCQN